MHLKRWLKKIKKNMKNFCLKSDKIKENLKVLEELQD